MTLYKLPLALLVFCAPSLPLACSSSSDAPMSPNSGGTAGAPGGGSATNAGAGAGGVAAATGGAAAGTGGTPLPSGGGNAGGADGGGSDAGGASGSDAGGAADDSPAARARGKYLTGLLGCVNCHTPKVNGMLDMANLFGGVDCTADAMGNCLSVPNLTPDATGLKDHTDQQVLDAFRLGKDPDAAMGMPSYLFANMPYYRFANLSDDDARAIVAYLRSVPALMHEVKENTGTFATQPAAPQWTPADPAKLPPPGAAAPADASNGKYLATIMCSTCHTVNTAATAPLHIDETKAFQGGKTTTPAGANMMMFQSANLTPDKTGLQGWTQDQIVTAITMAKDKDGKTLCAPMAGNPVITPEDAKSIADYLLSLTAVANSVTACMTRM